MQERLHKTECLREDIARLIEEQEQWKKQQKLNEMHENEKITQYIQEQEERSKHFKEMEYEKRLEISEQQERMCEQLNKIEVNRNLLYAIHIFSVLINIFCSMIF